MPLTFKQQVTLVAWCAATLILIELANMASGRLLNQFGNYPRQLSGLIGVLVGPWLHGNLFHLLSNLVPLCVFGLLMLQHGPRRSAAVVAFVVICTGTLVWVFGRSAYHIGSSGLVYGLFGYLLLAGFLARQAKLMAISLAVAFFYGGMVFGVLPLKSFVSWESHLFGLCSGLVAARLWAKTKESG